MPIDKQLKRFNFLHLTRGTNCNQGLKLLFSLNLDSTLFKD
jgi:hypothetical protein